MGSHSSSGREDLFLNLARDEVRKYGSHSASQGRRQPLHPRDMGVHRSLEGNSPASVGSKPSMPHDRNVHGPAELAHPVSRTRDQATRPYLDTRQGPSKRTGSEISIPPQSAVWEELSELRLRMRKLEQHSAASARAYDSHQHGSGRPGTGNTYATTSTSQNSHGDLLSSSTTRVTSYDSMNIHPLLSLALMKARNATSYDVFGALEGTVTGALELAAIGSRRETLDAHSLAKWADDLCRSLTELCMALTQPPSSSSAEPNPYKSTGNRSQIAGNGGSSPLAHAGERRPLSKGLELNPSAGHSTCDGTEAAQPTGRGSRAASVIPGSVSTVRPTLNRAATTQAQSAFGDYRPPPESTPRASSRAETAYEGSSWRATAVTHSPKDLRLSRDYTIRHPLPHHALDTRQFQRASFHDSSVSSTLTPLPLPTPHLRAKHLSNADYEGETIRAQDRQGPNHANAPIKRTRSRRSSSMTALRSPRSSPQPSSGAGILARLEAKRQQRVAAASQLRGDTTM